jgi:hypothetical protein
MDRIEMTKPEPAGELAPPDEPFACPACGQMLAPTCRVCVACQTAIDFRQLKRPEPELLLPSLPAPGPAPAPLGPARFSWRIFFSVLSLWILAALLSTSLLGADRSQVVMGSIVLVSSLWVFYDAQKNHVPKSLRWGVGSLLLWILVFPWYLARRRAPKAPCPFIEAEAGPVARVLFTILMIFFILGALLMFFHGPPPK